MLCSLKLSYEAAESEWVLPNMLFVCHVTQPISLYLFINFSTEQLLGIEEFIYFSTNAELISLNYLVSMYSLTTATHFGTEKIIFIEVAPLACMVTLMN